MINFDFSEALGKLISIAIALLVGVVGTTLIRKYATKLLSKTKVDGMVYRFVIQLLTIFVWVAVAFSIMNHLGMDVSSLLAVFAAAGAAVALALQGSLSNLASGLIIMITQPFGKGDYIKSGDVEGSVESISLLTTRIVSADNKVITVPNAQLTGSSITNETGKDTRRISFQIGIAYEADIENASKALLDMAAADERVLKSPEPSCKVESYDDSAVVLILKVWCATADYWNTKYDLQTIMKKTLSDAGVEIPFNQLDVTIKNPTAAK